MSKVVGQKIPSSLLVRRRRENFTLIGSELSLYPTNIRRHSLSASDGIRSGLYGFVLSRFLTVNR